MALLIPHPSQVKAGVKDKEVTDVPLADSSFIQNIKYDAKNFQLTVTLKSGGEYLYHHVYPQTANDFILSPSKGAFYSQVIKGRYPNSKTVNKNIGRGPKKEGRS